MTLFVVDKSVFLAGCLADEEEPTATAAMHHIAKASGLAPRIWWYELRNALLVSERRGRRWREKLVSVIERLYGQGRLTAKDVP